MELLNKIDETIIFNEHNVRIVKSTIDNEPWFVTKDICKILNLKQVRSTRIKKISYQVRFYFILGKLSSI